VQTTLLLPHESAQTNRDLPLVIGRLCNLMRRTNDGTGGGANALEFGAGTVDVTVRTAF